MTFSPGIRLPAIAFQMISDKFILSFRIPAAECRQKQLHDCRNLTYEDARKSMETIRSISVRLGNCLLLSLYFCFGAIAEEATPPSRPAAAPITSEELMQKMDAAIFHDPSQPIRSANLLIAGDYLIFIKYQDGKSRMNIADEAIVIHDGKQCTVNGQPSANNQTLLDQLIFRFRPLPELLSGLTVTVKPELLERDGRKFYELSAAFPTGDDLVVTFEVDTATYLPDQVIIATPNYSSTVTLNDYRWAGRGEVKLPGRTATPDSTSLLLQATFDEPLPEWYFQNDAVPPKAATSLAMLEALMERHLPGRKLPDGYLDLIPYYPEVNPGLRIVNEGGNLTMYSIQNDNLTPFTGQQDFLPHVILGMAAPSELYPELQLDPEPVLINDVYCYKLSISEAEDHAIYLACDNALPLREHSSMIRNNVFYHRQAGLTLPAFTVITDEITLYPFRNVWQPARPAITMPAAP